MNTVNAQNTSNNISRLDYIIGKTNNPENVKNTDIDTKVVIEKIKKKFPQLEHYEYRDPTKIKISEAIRYVDKKLSKVSIIGIVTQIEHYSYIDDNSKIKSIHLNNPYTETTWKINPDKYYLFKVHILTKEMKASNEMHDIIQKYLASLNQK